MLWEGDSVFFFPLVLWPQGVAQDPGDGFIPMPTWLRVRLVQLSALLEKVYDVKLGGGC